MRKMMRWVLLILAVVSCGMFLWQCFQGSSANETYADAAELAFRETRPRAAAPVLTEPPETTEAEEIPVETVWVPETVEDDPNMDILKDIDLEALREVNPDVVGWITVPESQINYPLMQGTDNEFYLKHTWEKTPNASGSIFIEHQNSPDLTDFNTIVYGHNMNNGLMFGSLSSFANSHYRTLRPYVYLVTDQGVYRYEVFSFYRAAVDGFTYNLSFQQDSTKIEFLMESKRSSLEETGVVPEPTDRILTLSTCAGGGYSHRWVVHARLKMVSVPA